MHEVRDKLISCIRVVLKQDGGFFMKQSKTREKNHIVVVLLVAIALFFASGCQNAQETLMQMRQELRQEIALNGETTIEKQDIVQKNRLEVPSLNDMLEDDLRIEETYEPVQTMGNVVPEIMVSLYFADEQGTKLIKKETKIPKVEGLARAVIETLLEGPDVSSGLVSAIPPGTQLLDINVKTAEKKCIVDFSQELCNILSAGGKQEQLAVYAITNTLCQFDSIAQVEFRVEGKSITTLAGTVNLAQPVSANFTLVKQ